MHRICDRIGSDGPDGGEEEAVEDGHDRDYDGHHAARRTLLLSENDADFQVSTVLQTNKQFFLTLY